MLPNQIEINAVLLAHGMSVGGGDSTRVVVSGVVNGSAISAGTLVDLSASDGTVTRSDAISGGAAVGHGIALTGGSSGNTISVCLKGDVTVMSGLCPATAYYVSSGGTLTNIASSASHSKLGFALSSTEIILKGYWERVEFVEQS